ncbi:MAG: PH domain-containing protein [Verrucomicrobia bacterium]|nr:PH domain-containing protein [Verrucomicrobiota bacterium]
MTTKHYAAPWERRVWLITGAFFLLGLAIALALPLSLPVKDSGERWLLWLSPSVVLMIAGVTSLWMVRRFELTDDAIIVRRSFWANRILLNVIESAEVDGQACERAWKTVGNDGLFAMHGRFRSKRLGKFQAYVTDPANAVVLKVPGDTIVISPEHPRQFVNDLNRRLAHLKEQR